jgi:hypothetical protein
MFWDGASLGDANLMTETTSEGTGYHMSHEDVVSPFVDRMFRTIWNGTGNRGVLYNWQNELAVTGVGSPVSVGQGAAIVYGLYYENTAALNVAIPTPTSDTRIDRLVVRRDWSAQTARVTRIVGTEGGSAPAITQSPAPTGTGIYDIPLAECSITTGGVITVTDEREYCTYCTGVPASGFTATQLQNSSIDWADRATTTKSFFLGGGDIEPSPVNGRFSYKYGYHSDLTGALPTWGGSAANEEGWRATGTGAANRRGFSLAFQMPADRVTYYMGPSIYTYIWWVAGAALTSSFYLRSMYRPQGMSGDYLSSTITDVVAVHDVIRSDALVIPWGYIGDGMNEYYIEYYNSAGAEDIEILGVEFRYTGYV